MANVLTGLIPTLYTSLDVVSRELVGFIPAVSRDGKGLERAALNETISWGATQAQSAADNTPAVTPPDTGDQTVDPISMTISKSKHVPIRWSGEDQKGVANGGNLDSIEGDQITQAMRTLVNLIEVDLFNEIYKNASRASGSAGTTPFNTSGDMSDLANVRQILDDNGCPQSDLQCVLGSAAVAKLRGKQSLLFKVNEAGSDGILRRGSITELPIEGFEMHNSGAIKQVTKGGGTSYQTNGAAAAGAASIALDTGSGNVLAGDVVAFTGDSNNYVVNTGITAPGTIKIGEPGILLAGGYADNNVMTIGNSYTPNMAFSKSAVRLITRVPAVPKMGDLAIDRTVIQDPVSGLAFEVAVYPQFRQTAVHIGIAWGVKAVKRPHIATMMG